MSNLYNRYWWLLYVQISQSKINSVEKYAVSNHYRPLMAAAAITNMVPITAVYNSASTFCFHFQKFLCNQSRKVTVRCIEYTWYSWHSLASTILHTTQGTLMFCFICQLIFFGCIDTIKIEAASFTNYTSQQNIYYIPKSQRCWWKYLGLFTVGFIHTHNRKHNKYSQNNTKSVPGAVKLGLFRLHLATPDPIKMNLLPT